MNYGRLLKAVCHFGTFLLIISFIVTCCVMLFVRMMAESTGVALTGGSIQMAARFTMGNVLALSLLLTACDQIRRKLTVERPAKIITEAGRQLMRGDFSVRIPKLRAIDTQDHFREIADCFNRMAEELSATETLRTDFVANVSHELKTPLAVMQNYGTLLRQPDLTEAQRMEYAKAITDAAGRLASLVTNILKLNKLENQQITPQFEEYDLGEQVCECLLGFEEAWEAKGLNIETDIEDGVTVSADAEMMCLVWNNLFSNAIKFTGPGGTVALSVRADGDCAEVRVRDTGCGISAEVGRHIFDKFYQGDPSHATQGNGLGLALVRRVVDITGGEISVESELGKGAAFTVRLRRRA